MVGIKIVRKIFNSLKPSIRAASMISSGKDLALCLKSMIKNGVEIVGNTYAIHVLARCIPENSLNNGIKVAANGTIIARSNTFIRRSFALS